MLSVAARGGPALSNTLKATSVAVGNQHNVFQSIPVADHESDPSPARIGEPTIRLTPFTIATKGLPSRFNWHQMDRLLADHDLLPRRLLVGILLQLVIHRIESNEDGLIQISRSPISATTDEQQPWIQASHHQRQPMTGEPSHTWWLEQL